MSSGKAFKIIISVVIRCLIQILPHQKTTIPTVGGGMVVGKPVFSMLI